MDAPAKRALSHRHRCEGAGGVGAHGGGVVGAHDRLVRLAAVGAVPDLVDARDQVLVVGTRRTRPPRLAAVGGAFDRKGFHVVGVAAKVGGLGPVARSRRVSRRYASTNGSIISAGSKASRMSAVRRSAVTFWVTRIERSRPIEW